MRFAAVILVVIGACKSSSPSTPRPVPATNTGPVEVILEDGTWTWPTIPTNTALAVLERAHAFEVFVANQRSAGMVSDAGWEKWLRAVQAFHGEHSDVEPNSPRRPWLESPPSQSLLAVERQLMGVFNE